ncbi:MAG: hypothetical protein H3Z52_03230 [archaeon]|nr:hypothetical protein [archaeon]MCP8319941.1 hypothetical protein [archaeon]
MAEIKDIVESRFEEAKKRVVAKYNEFVREIEEVLKSCEERIKDKFKGT